MGQKRDILGLSINEIEEELAKMNEKTFRAKQVFQWIYKGINDFDDMTDISKDLRKAMGERFIIGNIRPLKKLASFDGNTIKYLFLLHDNNIIESVVMKYKYGYSLCLSTQVGCRMGCVFCASTLQGLIRNLAPEEMVAQLLEVNRDLGAKGDRIIRNIVLMGSGEPLDNYESIINFLRIIHHPMGLGISYRNITLSTCGLVPAIRRLAEEAIPVTLSLSLHAPNDEIRKKIMPVAAAYGIDAIIEASKYYFSKTGRRVTVEYTLIRKLNDREEHALELVERLRDFPCHVNIIPLNELSELGFRRSTESQIQKFINVLVKNGVNVTRRRELGFDIEGACGQLRRSYMGKSPNIFPDEPGV